MIAIAASAVAPAGAQVVQGELRGADAGQPLPGAWLHLLSERGVAVDSTLTDRAGGFRLHAPAAGRYVVLFQMDGWASISSEPVQLEAGATTDLEFRVQLVPGAALLQMSEMIERDERMQTALPDLCGEELRSWEAGMLVGVVRLRATREPIAGARVSVNTPGGAVTRSTLSGESGIYILCNVPAGLAVDISAAIPDGTVERTDVEIRAGTVSWYDLLLGPRRR
jgi:hypothetical protein